MNENPFSALTFVAATAVECKALRDVLPNARVLQTGIAFEKGVTALGDAVVSCGLAGGLRADLATGTLLIPREVHGPGDRVLHCDAQLVALFAEAARRLGIEPIFDRLLTSDSIVRAGARAFWAARGYAGVDMETGRIVAARVAAVRVVLDTPQREISGDWNAPMRSMLKPWNWLEALWLAREAPRAASLVARVIAEAQGIGARLRITRQ